MLAMLQSCSNEVFPLASRGLGGAREELIATAETSPKQAVTRQQVSLTTKVLLMHAFRSQKMCLSPLVTCL